MVTQCVGEKWTDRAQNTVGWRKNGRKDSVDETETGRPKRNHDGIILLHCFMACGMVSPVCIMNDVVLFSHPLDIDARGYSCAHHILAVRFVQMCPQHPCNGREMGTESEISEDEDEDEKTQHNIWNKMLEVFTLQEGVQHFNINWKTGRYAGLVHPAASPRISCTPSLYSADNDGRKIQCEGMYVGNLKDIIGGRYQVIASLLGCAGQASDAVPSYTQVKTLRKC